MAMKRRPSLLGAFGFPASAVLAAWLAAVLFLPFGIAAQEQQATIPPGSYRSFSPFPIVMYDTDIGFGYGGRVKFVDYLGKKESLDLILFNSTKGERWYVFTFSIPDFEIRQGKSYGLSLDLKAEYDKYLEYSSYGLGPGTPETNETILTHETIAVPLTFGHGFTPRLVAEAAYVFRWLRYTDPREGPFQDEIAVLAARGRIFTPYLTFALRYDTSDSQIHPTRGVRFIVQDDLSGRFMGSRDSAFNRVTVDLRKYQRVFGAKDVFAVRALAQYVTGDGIPLFDHASLGGGMVNTALRGFPLNRFLDNGKFLVNAEYRFPIVWRLGGNVFADAGTVWHSLREIDLGETAFDAGVGLRFYMPDFVVRVDVAWSRE
ncbi:MAG TPA: BamA/TamA family outer membrane protein, partial [Acidobacteriota bacterium]|nr:BamA/TamA family outer membrane protein [Acidobacteriota bacterium]